MLEAAGKIKQNIKSPNPAVSLKSAPIKPVGGNSSATPDGVVKPLSSNPTMAEIREFNKARKG